jgi:GTPase SAR1 family protein
MMTVCLHPEIEQSILKWFDNRTTPAVFLVGPPGVGKTTLAYRVLQAKKLRVNEFNASHTRSGANFRKVILPLLERGGVLHMMENEGAQGGLGVILDEIDGLSAGEKGGLQTLLQYLRDWKPSNPGIPVIFISNTIQQRMLQMISRYCLTFKVGQANEQQVTQLIGHQIPQAWKLEGKGDLRPLLRGEYKNKNITEEEECSIQIPEGVVPLAKWCLYSEMDPFLTLEMENNDSNLAGLVLTENLPDRLEGVKGNSREAWDLYVKMFKCIQESDYADYWAFFYQTWRLLGLSQDVKLNTINLFLSRDVPWKGPEPTIESIRYTPVLTKQSALFNAWKMLCEIGDSKGIPIRLTPYVLRHSAGAATNTTASKKDNRKKKVESMNLIDIYQ